jgi:hypothetical protein
MKMALSDFSVPEKLGFAYFEPQSRLAFPDPKKS